MPRIHADNLKHAVRALRLKIAHDWVPLQAISQSLLLWVRTLPFRPWKNSGNNRFPDNRQPDHQRQRERAHQCAMRF